MSLGEDTEQAQRSPLLWGAGPWAESMFPSALSCRKGAPHPHPTPIPVGRGKERRPEEVQLLALSSSRLKH